MADQIVLWSDKSMKWPENVWHLTVISHSVCVCMCVCATAAVREREADGHAETPQNLRRMYICMNLYLYLYLHTTINYFILCDQIYNVWVTLVSLKLNTSSFSEFGDWKQNR